MDGLGGIILFLVCIIVYLFPTIVASSKQRKNSTAIFILNFFLGWSLIGWLVALIWATTEDK